MVITQKRTFKCSFRAMLHPAVQGSTTPRMHPAVQGSTTSRMHPAVQGSTTTRMHPAVQGSFSTKTMNKRLDVFIITKSFQLWQFNFPDELFFKHRPPFLNEKISLQSVSSRTKFFGGLLPNVTTCLLLFVLVFFFGSINFVSITTRGLSQTSFCFFSADRVRPVFFESQVRGAFYMPV